MNLNPIADVSIGTAPGSTASVAVRGYYTQPAPQSASATAEANGDSDTSPFTINNAEPITPELTVTVPEGFSVDIGEPFNGGGGDSTRWDWTVTITRL